MKKIFIIPFTAFLIGFSSHALATDWNDVIGVFSENGQWRLDIGTFATKQVTPASHNSWATRLRIRRLDGPSAGFVEPNHIIGIFSENGQWRLDIGTLATKQTVPASHNSWATRLRIVPLNKLALGKIAYGDVVGVFSEDGTRRLDIGTAAMKQNVPASHDSWATRFRIQP